MSEREFEVEGVLHVRVVLKVKARSRLDAIAVAGRTKEVFAFADERVDPDDPYCTPTCAAQHVEIKGAREIT